MIHYIYDQNENAYKNIKALCGIIMCKKKYRRFSL